MIFGWEGFTVEHPDDWAPVAMNGTRREGYVRIASPGRLALQVRWKSLKSSPDLLAFRRDYFKRLARDARRRKISFVADDLTDADASHYSYRGATFGRGFIRSASDGRVFVIEVSSTQSDSLKRPLREIEASFSTDDALDTWALLGLHLRLPKGLAVERRELLAGRTRLWLRGKGVKISAERWAFAEQLLHKHLMEDWVRAVLDAPKAQIVPEAEGLRVQFPRSWRRVEKSALVRQELAENQIVIVASQSRNPKWRPEWDWLTQ